MGQEWYNRSAEHKIHTDKRTHRRTVRRTHRRTDTRSDRQSDRHNIVVVLVYNNNKLLLTKVAEIFATHPDFAFWIEEKLKPDTVLRWIEEFSDVPIKS